MDVAGKKEGVVVIPATQFPVTSFLPARTSSGRFHRLVVLHKLLLSVLWFVTVHVAVDFTLRGVHWLWADKSVLQPCLVDNEVRCKLLKARSGSPLRPASVCKKIFGKDGDLKTCERLHKGA